MKSHLDYFKLLLKTVQFRLEEGLNWAMAFTANGQYLSVVVTRNFFKVNF